MLQSKVVGATNFNRNGMMVLELLTENKNDFSILLAITLFGAIEALSNNAITFDEARSVILNPYVLDKAIIAGCDNEVIELIDKGLELDCIKRQFPELFQSSICEIRDNLVTYLVKVNISNNIIVRLKT